MIDFYGFVGPWPYWDAPHTDPAGVLRSMERHGIDALAVCSTRSIFSDWRRGNEEILALSKQYAGRFVPFVCVSPIVPGPEIARYLREYHESGAKGLRLYPQHQSYTLGLTAAAPIFETVQSLGWPVVLPVRIIMDWALPQIEKSAIESTVRRYPGLQFVLSGINYDLTAWAYDVMQRRPNVHLEISGLQGFRAVDYAVRKFGAERFLFGSGLPLMYPLCSTEKLRTAGIDDSARRAIADGNARRLLRMPPKSSM